MTLQPSNAPTKHADAGEAREGAESVSWQRLQDQLAWYDQRSHAAKQAFLRWKVGELIAAAAIPVAAAFDLALGLVAILGAVVVVLEGFHQLFQWQTNWTLYRFTAEALKHEKFLYLACSGPYLGVERGRVLAERLEGLISQEHARWAEAQERIQD